MRRLFAEIVDWMSFVRFGLWVWIGLHLGALVWAAWAREILYVVAVLVLIVGPLRSSLVDDIRSYAQSEVRSYARHRDRGGRR